MHRGTTPTLTFKVPFNPNTLSECYITFKQVNYTFEKKLSDCTTTDSTISVQLTQQDTLGLDSKADLNIQLRVKYIGGSVDASNIISIAVNDILKEGSI